MTRSDTYAAWLLRFARQHISSPVEFDRAYVLVLTTGVVSRR